MVGGGDTCPGAQELSVDLPAAQWVCLRHHGMVNCHKGHRDDALPACTVAAVLLPGISTASRSLEASRGLQCVPHTDSLCASRLCDFCMLAQLNGNSTGGYVHLCTCISHLSDGVGARAVRQVLSSNNVSLALGGAHMMSAGPANITGGFVLGAPHRRHHQVCPCSTVFSEHLKLRATAVQCRCLPHLGKLCPSRPLPEPGPASALHCRGLATLLKPQCGTTWGHLLGQVWALAAMCAPSHEAALQFTACAACWLT